MDQELRGYLEEQFGSIRERFVVVEQRLEGIEHRLHQVERDTSRLGIEFDRFRHDFKAGGEQYEGLAARVRELSDSFTARFDRLEQWVRGWKSTIDALDARLKAVESRPRRARRRT